MNYSIIAYIIGSILKLEAVFMLLPCITALIYQEQSGFDHNGHLSDHWFLAYYKKDRK